MSQTNRHIRQSGLVDHKILSVPITMIGAGGIGSFTALTLAKMGFNDITVFDFDTVEEHNLASQFYRDKDIGATKVEALDDIIKSFCNIHIKAFAEKVDAESGVFNGVIIPAVDNMATRTLIYRKCKRNGRVRAIVDGRMGGNQAEVYTIDTLDREQKSMYEKTLWEDSEASNVPCTERAVMYNVLWIASTIANNVRLLLTGKPYHPINIMDLENSMLHQPEGR